MYIVRLEFQQDRLAHLQTAIHEHTKRAIAVAQRARPGEQSTLGTIAMLPIADPGQPMKRGRAEDTRTTVAGSQLYRELLLGHADTLLATRLGNGALEFYASDYEGIRGRELPERPVAEGAQGIALLYDRTDELDAAFDRMHELMGNTLPNNAADRRAGRREQVLGMTSLNHMFDQADTHEPPMPYGKSA